VDQDLQAKPEAKEQVASRVKVVCQDLRDPEETRAQKELWEMADCLEFKEA